VRTKLAFSALAPTSGLDAFRSFRCGLVAEGDV
jgi:hypothetical protein